MTIVTEAKQQNVELPTVEEKPAEKKLSARHRAFCEEFLVDYNGTQAYARVYKAKPDVARANAAKLLANANIRAYLEKRVEELQATLRIQQERVLRELRNVGYANMADFVTFGPHGVTLKNSEDLTRDQLAAVSQVTETITQHGGTKTIKLHAKVEALSKLGENLRLFDEDKLKDLSIAVQVVNVR